MTDPTDKELLEFVARFAGWSELTSEAGTVYGVPDAAMKMKGHCYSRVTDYLNSVDAWLRDVWPKIALDAVVRKNWYIALTANARKMPSDDINADARSRCLALYRALDGKLSD